jgi:hypothetical protein
LCLCVRLDAEIRPLLCSLQIPDFRKASRTTFMLLLARVANGCLSLKLRPVRRAHTCLSEGREPVSKALAQVLGTTKEFSYTREILARTSYLEPLNSREPSRFL